MKRFMLIASILLMLMGAVSAQGQDNLLTNPGFEPPFTEVSGNPPRQVAEGWQPWHLPAAAGSPSFQNRQPEYAPTAPDAPRIRGGSDAQQISSFFATHVGGVYQTVTGITPGTRLRFSVYAYVWSTTFEEPEISEEDGDVSVEVGIDPAGGTDATSSSIVWSPLIEQYDAYNEYSIEADATGTSVTVFVRTSAGVPVKHNNIYLDDAALGVAGEATTEPGTGTEEPTAEITAEPVASATPITPEATAEVPSSTPITPEITAEAPSATPVTPEATVEAPTATAIVEATAEVPSVTPVTPEVTVEVPSATPITPEATVEAPTATAIVEATAEVPSVTPIVEVTAEAPSATPITPEATAEPTLPISEQFPFTVTHVVSANENVAAIAERYGSTVDAIAEVNDLDENYLIFVGQELIIPVATDPAISTATATVTPPQIIVTATPVPPTVAATPSATPFGTATVYVVRSGDTLTRISRLFNTTITAIARANGIVNPNIILAGQRLNIPGATAPTPVPTATTNAGGQQPTATATTPANTFPTATPLPTTGREYIVRFGDSLYTISLRFGVPIRVIAQANNIRNTWLIYAGQRLIIP